MRVLPMLIALILGLAAVLPAAGQEYTLTIFHNNDGESVLLPDGEIGGAARFVAKLNELRTGVTSDGQLMLSSGDNFLPGPVFNASLDHGIPFYDTQVMDLIGYDAVCIGNHDFDFGPDVLADFINGFTAAPPYLSCNLDFSLEPALQALVDAGVIAGSAVVETGGQQLGIVGATTENLVFISSPRDVVVNAVAPAIQAQIDALTAAGIDKIILISHLQSILEDLALAAELTGVDVMIAGGGDELLANPGDLLIPGDEGLVYDTYPIEAVGADLAVIPVVTTAGNYQYIGRLEVTFDATGNVIAASGGPVRVVGTEYADGVEPDPVVQSTIIEPIEDYLDALATTVLATSEVDLDGVRSRVRTQETNQGNLCADALLWNARRLAADFGVPMADVALQNGGGIRNDSVIPAGPLTALNIWQMLPFSNFVAVVEDIGREQFKEILENCVSRVEFGDGRFAQVAGLRFRWDESGQAQELDAEGNVVTPGSRVIEAVLMDDPQTVLIQGGVVVPGAPLTVATIDFLANGGDQYPFRGASFTRLGLTYQQSLSAYLTDGLQGLVTMAAYPEGGEGRILTGGTVSIEAPVEPGDRPLPQPVLQLEPNYPNPFNPITTIAFELPGSEQVKVAIYDPRGRLVRVLADEVRDQGRHELIWDGTDAAGQRVASGPYLYRLQTEGRVQSRTMILAK